MNKLIKLAVFLITLSFSPLISGEDIVGSERCKLCHKEEYEKFSKTAHKDTSKSLNAEQRKNKECLICHSMDKEGKYMEIGCEACHGGGKYYSYDYIMIDKELARLIGLKIPDENFCQKCHTQETTKINKMNIKEGMKKIEHKKESKKLEKDTKESK